MIFQVFYASSSLFEIDNPVDLEILKQARRNNSRLELTGCLFRSRNYFAQLLEGPRDSVEATMAKIRADVRHFDIFEWPQSEAPARTFKDWDMGFAAQAQGDAILLALKHADQQPVAAVVNNLKNLFATQFNAVPD